VSEPYLSIVCAFGHAQRSPAWLKQTRQFLSATAIQAARHRLSLEIILVDRDSAGEGTAAANLLGALPCNEFADIRIISVPGAEILNGHVIDRERRLQNIGIRRARGAFVLATGTDVIFGSGLVKLFAARVLREGSTYHALRIDTAPAYLDPSCVDPAEAETLCRQGAFAASLPPLRIGFDGRGASMSDTIWDETIRRAGAELGMDRMANVVRFSLGNFLLMSRENWLRIGGFPEWNVSDPYFDRIALVQARYLGWPTTIAPVSCHYFSVSALRDVPIERDLYLDEDGDLRIKIELPPIRHLNNWQSAKLLTLLNNALPIPPAGPPVEVRVNASDWGLGGFDLPEVTGATLPASATDIIAQELRLGAAPSGRTAPTMENRT